MGRGVTQNLDTGIIALGDDRQLAVLINHEGGIDLPAINHTSKGSFGEARADIERDIVDGNGLGERSLGTIGKGNNRHKKLLSQWRSLPRTACGRVWSQRSVKNSKKCCAISGNLCTKAILSRVFNPAISPCLVRHSTQRLEIDIHAWARNINEIPPALLKLYLLHSMPSPALERFGIS